MRNSEFTINPSMQRHLSSFVRNLITAVLLLGVTPAICSAQEPADVAPNAIQFTEEQKFALKALDAELARFDATLAKVSDQQYRNQSKVYLDILKLRAMGIRKEFDQTRYDELRFDLNAEYQRVALWLANLVHTVPIAKDGTPPEVALYKLKPSAGNPAEIKAALGALDHQLKRLEARANLAPAGPPGEPERVRLKAIQQHRNELEKDFSKARWDEVVREVKSELDKIPH
jgi:hypothetical protein